MVAVRTPGGSVAIIGPGREPLLVVAVTVPGGQTVGHGAGRDPDP